MRSNPFKAALIKSGLAASVLLLAGGSTFAQSVVNLTAGPSTATLPDGAAVPMWGYTCTGTQTVATCAALNPNAGTGWSPVLITVPVSATGPTSLTINLTNSLSFAAGTGTNTVPTSLVIVGQLGGGLGGTPTRTQSPVHAPQGTTWPVAGAPDTSGQLGGDPNSAGNTTFTPPHQGDRVQSFGSEVAVGATATALTWPALNPGTYLIESGTHPSIQGPMGLYGVLVVTTAPGTAAGCAYPGATAGTCAVPYNAEVPLLLSEIDAVQNSAVQAAVTTAGFSETKVWSGQPGQCGNPMNADGTANTTYHTCYPPAVNYDPRYYLVSGVSFDRTQVNATISPSAFPTTPATASGTVLVRFVNAGLRMHIPSIVGAQTNNVTTTAGTPTTTVVSGISLIAEDGNVAPGSARVQSEVFLAAGKTYDVMINAPATGAPALPVFDRQLSLSTNNQREGGMQAFITTNGSVLPATASTPVARDDSYFLVAGGTLSVSDPGKGVIANDTAVYGVTVLTQPTGGTLTLNGNGTFKYVPNAGTASDSFVYCANGSVTTTGCSSGLTATVTLAACTASCQGAAPVAHAVTFTSNVASLYASAPPGVLGNVTNSSGLPLTAQFAGAANAAITLNVDGSFVATGPGGACPGTLSPTPPTGSTCQTFSYQARSSTGMTSGSAVATVVFLPASNLSVTVFDAMSKNQITDYRWVIEEDRTFNINPATQEYVPCVSANTPPGCGTTVQNLGTNFHTSYMPLVAAGCVGQYACEFGQMMIDPAGTGTHVNAVCDIGNGVCRAVANAQQTPVDPSQVHLDPTKRYYISILPGDAGNSFTAAAGSPVQVSGQPITLTKSGMTVTATISQAGGRVVTHVVMGDTVVITGASVAAWNGTHTVLAATDTSFTYLAGGASSGISSALYSTANPRPFDLARDCPLFATDYAPGTGTCGHTMSGAPIPAVAARATTFAPVVVLDQPTPLPTAKVAVFVFEDDSPLNGEHDSHGGTDAFGSAKEPGLGGFEITLFDDAGGTGDATGQMTYDMFNMPLSNSLAGTIDQVTHADACAISTPNTAANPALDHLVGMIVTCPHFESDGTTVSPLEGQAVIANLMPGRYGVVATPAADRIGRGEEWLQTNTLDGQKAHDSFIKVGGPAYFQEFGPAGYHVSVGFANPAIINSRTQNGVNGICDPTSIDSTGANVGGGGQTCDATVTGTVTDERQSRTPDQRLYSSGSGAANAFTNCYVSMGDPDDDDFAFTKCDANGNFTLTNVPHGNWRITVFDQWNDLIVDGLSTPVALVAGPNNLGDLPKQQWHTNIYTRTFLDLNKDGVSNLDTNGNLEPGLTLLPTNVRFRDGSYSNFNNTDLNGFAGFNEIFPLFNWYVIEADTARYKQTGIHVVYDAGGPADATGGGPLDTTGVPCTAPNTPVGCNPNFGMGIGSNIASGFANTLESVPLPPPLRFPGSVYCADADCSAQTRLTHPIGGGPGGSTGRIDPPWVTTEGWQGFIGSSEFIEFGKTQYATGENGGIRGEVIYASTRPFDDPALLIHTSWTPDVPGVTINLYQELTAPDGSTGLTLVDTTKTTSWDDWAQGFRSIDGTTGIGIPNMNCPGQQLAPTSNAQGAPGDLFFFTLKNTTNWLKPTVALASNSQFKCYDGLHIFNQVQPAPYDGMYQFPSVTARDPVTGKPTATNCTGCIRNTVVPITDYDYNAWMLPAGKYVVEMILPPGYELVKEEDKNILIGDNYIAPVTQQFAGLGSIFILPDQAAVAATYNANNAQNPTQDLGSAQRHEGDTGSVETFWPCVGALRIVPDYISLFPYSAEVSPFAGASRRLCDRKEVTLEDQTQALAKFWIFSSTHVAAHFTGFILDDFSSEFDPFAPQFGEKFAVPTLPVSIKDFAGNESSRVYSDQWGQYNGLNYSTWQVNPPNPTGYAPTMMVACMNDPGNGTIPDPYYNSNYSQFCYEIPYMPGQTQYMDTPVVPTAAFAEGYNPADCAYPDFTPAISTVTGDVPGPWVSATGRTLIINALTASTGPGVQVPNNAYSGPSATIAPFNQKFVTRHYGFGTTPGSVTIGGVNSPLTGIGWTDTQIQATVPDTLPICQPSGQATGSGRQQIYHGAEASDRCGELVITAANGKKSIDTVMVTAGGATPTVVTAENAANNAIQTAIDNAAPGAMIIVAPGVYNEMLVMWKPVRLQGVGAASVKVNANTHPSGKLDSWRRQVECLFGLSLNGGFINSSNPFDPSNTFACPASMQGKVDPIPLEPQVAWDPNLNGNLAELLLEPTLLGAYEGAGITVVGKGLANANTPGICDAIDAGGCIALTNTTAECTANPSNFLCNPSRIDGITFVNSSQGGGGIFLHGWNPFAEVSNNRVYANAGTLSGGITIGQPENPDPTVVGTIAQPLGFNSNVQVHNNSVTQNASYGDELNSTTPMAAGGVTFCTGADNYQFNHNWVCGNLSTGDGGGFAHFGFIAGGNISNNSFLFNQSSNPTIPTHGGGLAILGQPPDGTVCENQTVDTDCAPTLGDGIGGRPTGRSGSGAVPDLVIDANLILGNTAESGSGGGIRLQNINGNDAAVNNPGTPNNWWWVSITNNIIVNNVAGWDGAGVSMQDALRTDFINNTVVDNDTTASAGVLFNTLGAANANTPPQGCKPNPNPNTPQDPSCYYGIAPTNAQPAGLSVQDNDSVLISAFGTQTVTCPPNHFPGGSAQACKTVSYPMISNDLFWQNRAFHIQVGGLGAGTLSQQNLVTLVPTLNQASTGDCQTTGTGNTGSVVYWDIGYRGDTNSTTHDGNGVALAPRNSILTSTAGGYAGSGNIAAGAVNPGFISFYCDGSRVPPENPQPFAGYIVPAGVSDATIPNPVFNLTAAATVDEGNNWVNMQYGPLSLYSPANQTGTGAPLGNYSISGGPAVDAGSATGAPGHDFFGTARPQGGGFDIGAVELAVGGGGGGAIVSVTPTSLTFGNQLTGTTSASQNLTLSNTGTAAFASITLTFSSAGFSRFNGGGFPANAPNCGVTLAAGQSCRIKVRFAPGTATGAVSGMLTITGIVPVTGSPVQLSGTGVQALTASLSPSPIAAPAGVNPQTGSGTVTLTNPAAPGGASVTLTAVNLPAPGTGGNGSLTTWFFSTATDNCTGVTLAPGGTCTVVMNFTSVNLASGANRTATMSVIHDGFTNPTVTLAGHKN
jgi:Bacterial Ig domain